MNKMKKQTEMHFNNGYFLEKEQIDIIDKFHKKNEPPYYITDLIKEFNEIVELVRVKIPNNISGAIIKMDKMDNDRYKIYLNAGDYVTRRRFTAAHELAHFLLHKEDIGDGIQDDALYRSRLSNHKEAQANKLAADILMPYDKLYEYLDKGKELKDLPEIFRVSVPAMCIRLNINEFVLLDR